jgi:hypothetical protein
VIQVDFKDEEMVQALEANGFTVRMDTVKFTNYSADYLGGSKDLSLLVYLVTDPQGVEIKTEVSVYTTKTTILEKAFSELLKQKLLKILAN